MQATASKPSPLIRFLPGLTDVAFLMPMVFLFARMDGAKSMLGDGDTGWHVRTGEWILAHGRVPHEDFFSFTKSGQPWYAWEWLWDLCFAWLYHHGGLATVVSASIVVLCTTFALLYRLILRRCENPFLAIGATFLACAGSTLHWLARPHLFTLFFTVVLLMMLDRVHEGKVRWLYAFPPLMIVWVNFHGGFLAGLIIIGAFSAGEVLRAIFAPAPQERAAAMQKAKWYAVAGVLGAAATLVNPYTYHLHVHIFQYFSEPYHMANVVEFQSISFHDPAAIYLELALLLGALSAGWIITKHRNFVPLVLMVGWGHLALVSARNIPLFVITAAPFIAKTFEEMLAAFEHVRVADWAKRAVASFRSVGDEFGVLDRHWRIHALSASAIWAIVLLLGNPNATGKLKPEYDPKRYPAAALSVLRASANSRIFTDDEWGDYLIYQLYPEHKVFVDGRSDFYGQDFEQKYLDLMYVKYDWEKFLDKYGVDTILLSPGTALASTIKESAHWHVIYDDTVAVIFRRVQPVQHEFSTEVRGKTGDSTIIKAARPASEGHSG